MNKLSEEDRKALQDCLPPKDPELLRQLTIETEWLTVMKDYCLQQVIAQGGSKVKILHGGHSTGKTHFMQSIKLFARDDGFFVIDMDLSRINFHLTDSVAFYKAIASELDLKKLEEVLIDKLVTSLGYTTAEFITYGGALTDFICEVEKSQKAEAKKIIRRNVHEIVNQVELDFAFRKFLHMFMEAVVERDRDYMEVALNWMRGNKIDRPLKTFSHLYETLAKYNARSWLYSLMELIKFMGYKGVVILLDQFEAILPKSGAVMNYTPMRRNDVYELLRQLIDDLDFFKNILILISGNSEIYDNEIYGLQSYHALWMRLQPGFLQEQNLNVYADLIDADLLFWDLQQKGLLDSWKEKLVDLDLTQDTSKQADRDASGWAYSSFRDILHPDVQDGF